MRPLDKMLQSDVSPPIYVQGLILVRLSSNEEVDDQLRAVLAVRAMNRKQFNKVVID